MAATLVDRQQISFVDLVDLWKPTHTVNTSTAVPSQETLTLTETSVRCRYAYTDNLSDPSGFGGRIKRPTVFTTDAIQFAADQVIGDGWIAVNRSIVNGTAGPLFNEVHEILGSQRVTTNKGDRRGNNLKMLAQTMEHPPTAIVAFYGLAV